MQKKRVVKVMLIVLLILALVLSAGYLYLYNHGFSYDADVVVFMMGTNDSKPESTDQASPVLIAACIEIGRVITR